LIGLLACTGLRISEALRFTRADFDAEQGVLQIRETKFRKSRFVPLHPSATKKLVAYARDRDRLVPGSQTDRFFVTDRGKPLTYGQVRHAFRQLCDDAGIVARGHRSRPVLHDLRHTFACRRVERWYDTGEDVTHCIAALSTYLGHATIHDTYWYLTATPELLERAAARFQPGADEQREGQS
jgi:integrase